MKHTLKRLLAFLLAIGMVCGLLPTLAFAEEPTEASAELKTTPSFSLISSTTSMRISPHRQNVTANVP